MNFYLAIKENKKNGTMYLLISSEIINRTFVPNAIKKPFLCFKISEDFANEIFKDLISGKDSLRTISMFFHEKLMPITSDFKNKLLYKQVRAKINSYLLLS
jgi:hypothetical protein